MSIDSSAPLIPATRSRRTLDVQTVVPVLGMVLLVGAIVAGFDLWLVRFANRHRSESGAQFFAAALKAKQSSKPAEALELFRSAYNRNPRNPEYHFAFAQALLSAGRSVEGQAAVEQFLAAHPAHGAANAQMARLLSTSGDWQRAAWYYHRALYGEWTQSTDLRAIRFELAEMLAQHQAREQLVSEVVLLTAEPPRPGEAARLASLHLAGGDWARAEQIYRTLLRSEGDSPLLLAGLARAQFGLGRYAIAERTFRRAVASGPTDANVAKDFALAISVNAMDPTIRSLAAAEKHRRAHELAAALVAALRKCASGSPGVAEAQTVLASHRNARNSGRDAEVDLDMIDRLWPSREAVCGNGLELSRAVELVIAHITR